MHFGSDQLAQYGKTVLHKKDGSTIKPNKDRPTSLDIAKICAAYECNEVRFILSTRVFHKIDFLDLPKKSNSTYKHQK